MALIYFPLPRPNIPRAVLIGKESVADSPSMEERTKASLDEKARAEGESSDELVRYPVAEDMNHVVMDRMSWSAEDEER